MAGLLLVLGIGLFISLIIAHELGHFIMARRAGITVLEFGLGFPPRILRKRTKGGWDLSLNALPIGGFVRLKGEHDADTEPGSFGAASLVDKSKVLIAGVTMNLVIAYLLLVLLALVGMPQVVDNQFTVQSDALYVQRARQYIAANVIEQGSPAAAAGLRQGDAIVSLGRPGHMVELANADALPKLTAQYAGQVVALTYRSGAAGQEKSATVTLRSAAAVQAAKAAGKSVGYLGVSAYEAQDGVTIIRSRWSSPIVAAGITWQFTALTFQGLGKAIAGLGSIIAGGLTGNQAARQAGQAEASSQVAGPVGIFFVLKYGSALGIRFILLIVALLSLTLAIMNILPIPALDGGRLWLMLASHAIRKPLTQRREEAITMTGFALLMGLVILITIVDVKRFF